ncbi:histidine kinase N-terminal 7TM domain-containing protein [Halorubellus litoreus]|uniref:histidine kinase n=1 Tax=Halorubellus litoreus TaxID=755308 RepID=A0ABD5VEG7_9EURY
MLPTTPVAWFALGATLMGAALSYAVGYVAWRREADAPRVRGYASYVAVGGTWGLAYALVLLSPTTPLAFAFDVLRATTATATAWLFLLFVANYTGHRDRLERPLRLLLAVDVVGYTVVYATEPWHGLLFAEEVRAVTVDGLTVLTQVPSLAFTLHFLFVVGAVLYGVVLLARYAFAARNVYREQTTAVLLGTTVTLAGAVAVAFNLAGSGNWQYFDPTPFAFALNGVVIGWALLRLDFLTVGPLAANTLIAEMTDAVFVLDDDDRVVDANPTAAALVDGDPIDRELAAVLPGVAAAVESGESVELPAPDDVTETAVYDVNVSPLLGPYDVRRGSLLVLRDVTERTERERLLERRNEQLDEFANVVSHDLRNPLGVAKGYAELAAETGDEDAIEEVRRALDRMDDLVEDVLALARNDRDAVDPEPVELAAAARSAWQSVETDAGTLDVTDDAVVLADRSRLLQAFENLFRNAMEHGATGTRSDGGATDAPGVRVTVGVIDDDAGFFVADDGPGIPESDRDAVFESGYSTAGDGTGYGLAIVERVADGHGWRVHLAESVDGGARFEFRGVDRVDD